MQITERLYDDALGITLACTNRNISLHNQRLHPPLLASPVARNQRSHYPPFPPIPPPSSAPSTDLQLRHLSPHDSATCKAYARGTHPKGREEPESCSLLRIRRSHLPTPAHAPLLFKLRLKSSTVSTCCSVGRITRSHLPTPAHTPLLYLLKLKSSTVSICRSGGRMRFQFLLRPWLIPRTPALTPHLSPHDTEPGQARPHLTPPHPAPRTHSHTPPLPA